MGMEYEHTEIITYTDQEINIWYMVAQLKRISAEYEQQEWANLALHRALKNLN